MEKPNGVKVYSVDRLFPTWASGQTWYKTILIKREFLGHKLLNQLIAHELVHVDQWVRHGIIGFPVLYVIGYIKAWRKYGRDLAYKLNEFEVEAREDCLAHEKH